MSTASVTGPALVGGLGTGAVLMSFLLSQMLELVRQQLRAQETHEHCACAQPPDKRRPRHPMEILHRVLPDVLPVRPGSQPLVQAGPASVPCRQENHENSNDEHGYAEEEIATKRRI